jgi:hypothetical protein
MIGGCAMAVAGTAPAAAQFHDRAPITRNFETRGPVRGYSGFVRIGPRNYYCDYIRTPNRTCTTDRQGRESCRITSWTLRQTCY